MVGWWVGRLGCVQQEKEGKPGATRKCGCTEDPEHVGLSTRSSSIGSGQYGQEHRTNQAYNA